jgi:hypothetical protein
MAKTNKKIGDNNVVAKKTTSTYEAVPMVNIPKTVSPQPLSSQQTSGSSQASGRTQASTGAGTLDRPAGAVKPKTPIPPTHKQIEDRAMEIWRRKGCPCGQDEQNWLEAEAQLKKEMSAK